MGSHTKYQVAVLIVAITCGYFAKAQNKTSTSVSTKSTDLFTGMSLYLDLAVVSDLEEENSESASRSTDLEMIVTKKFENEDSLSFVASASRENTGFQDTTLSNSLLIYSLKGIKLTRDETLIPSLRALLPTNEEDYEDDSLRGGVAARLQLLSSKQLLDRPIKMGVYVDGLKYVHQFQTNANGGGNLNYRVRGAGQLTLQATDQISLNVLAYYQAGETYQGALRSAFYATQEVVLKPNQSKASFYLAHTNNGNALGGNGQDSNIELFDDRTSVISAGLRAQF